MATNKKSLTFTIPDSVLTRTDDKEHVTVMNSATSGDCYKIHGAAAAAWILMIKNNPYEAVVEKLAKTYSQPENEIQKELESFLKKMESYKLIKIKKPKTKKI